MTLKALILNTSLKSGDEQSHTAVLSQKLIDLYQEHDVETEMIRIADYHLSYGIDVEIDDKDEWPMILDKIKEADILVIGTPLWLGEKSSIATLVIERLYGSSKLTNDKGQAIFYNKVGGVIVTGNEDGAKHASASVLYGLSHIGFTIPPNVDAYWVGEAGPGPSYIDAGQDNEFTKQHIKWLGYNTMHLARMLKDHPIPAEGNLLNND